MAHLVFLAKIFYHKLKREEIPQSNPECANFNNLLDFFLKRLVFKKKNKKRWKNY